MSAPLSFVRGGVYFNSTWSQKGYVEYYWVNKKYSNDSSYTFQFSSSGFSVSGFVRGDGFSLRCVVR